MAKKKTVEEFIEQSKALHGDKFDYSHVDYKSQCESVVLICNKHNHKFSVIAKSHLSGPGGCKLCHGEAVSKAKRGKSSSLRKTTEQFIEESKVLHGNKYAYNKCVYTTTHGKVELFCNTCKEYFFTYAGDHIKPDKATGCPKCGLANRRPVKSKRTYKRLLEELGELHDLSKYEILNDKELYPLNSKITIKCLVHNSVQTKYIGDMLKKNRNPCLCSLCSGMCVSNGEIALRKKLSSIFQNVSFEYNARPSWLVFGDSEFSKELDIFLPELNLAIEYNGGYWHSVEYDDKFKEYHLDKYNTCLKNDVQLLYIWDFENIDKWLRKLCLIRDAPNDYCISFSNAKRTVNGLACYGQSIIKHIKDN